ncbi:MAG: hypothetical protein B7Z66_04820 [Chromatiales bacterium 21-64-14]|nr:MAG: hypothetical protein B7Z66_04820 [Chromatiales bacterium 21-64-14]HQU14651.1 MMPL family transporter [Gammaproteobacteria bacterium]
MIWRVRATLLLWVMALLGCVAVIAHSRYTADMSAFLPRTPNEQAQILVDQLQHGLVSRLILIGIDGADLSDRVALSRALAQKLRTDHAFVAVNNGEASGIRHDFRFIFDHRYVLNPRTTPELFTVSGLHHAIAGSIDQLALPLGEEVKALLPADPTGATVELLNDLAGGAQPQKRDGVWVEPGAGRTLLVAQTRASGADTDGQAAAMAEIQSAFATAQAKLGGSAAQNKLVLSGPGVFSVQSRAAIKDAVQRVSLIGGVLIVALLLSVYRSLPVLLLGLLPVFSGVLAGIAAVSLSFGVVQGLTLGFGTTLIGETVDYSIYLFVQSGAAGDAARRDWLGRFWPTIRLGMLTSVCGFATLLLSNFPGLTQLGVYSIAGLLSAALVTRFVLPHLLPRRFGVRDLRSTGAHLLRAVVHLQRARWVVPALVLVACVVLFGHRQQLWSPQLSSLSPVSARSLALDAQLRRALGAPDAGDLVAVRGASADAALSAAEAVGTRLRALVARGVIAGFDSPAHYLPSIATQRNRLAAIPAAAALRTRLAAAVRGLPVKPALFTPFVDEAEAARHAAPLTLHDLSHTDFYRIIDSLLLRQRDGTWSALLPLRAPTSGLIDAASVNAALIGSGAKLFNVGQISNHLYASYLRATLWLSLAGLGAITVLLLVALRSAVRVVRVLAPLLSAVLVVTSGLVLAGVQLTLLHLIGMMLIVAVGSNYALFFDRGSVEGGIAPRTLASLVFANLTTVAGFGTLAFSGVPVLRALGVTVGPGALIALLFSALLARRSGSTRGALR